MHPYPRQKLAEIIARYGQVVCEEPRHLELLLRDSCPEHRREVNLLLSALREGMPARLMESRVRPDIDVLARQLSYETGITVEFARWAVESWQVALNSGERPEPVSKATPAKAPVLVEQRKIPGRGRDLSRLRFSADSSRISALSGRSASIWDIASADEMWRLEDAVRVAYSTDLRFAASCGDDRRVYIWDTQTGQAYKMEGQTDHPGGVMMGFSPNGKRLVGKWNQQVVVWDVASGAVVHRYQSYGKDITTFAVSPQSDLLFVGALGDVHLWDLRANKIIWHWKGDPRRTAISPSWQTIVYIEAFSAGPLHLWDISAQQQLPPLQIQETIVGNSPMSFSADGQLFALGTIAGGHAWELGTRQELWRCEDKVHTLSFRPDGQVLSYVQDDGTVQLWDVAGQRALGPIADPTAQRPWFITFSPDGRFLEISGEKQASLWYVSDHARAPLLTGKAHNFVLNGDGSLLATWDNKETINIFSLADGDNTVMKAQPEGGPTASRRTIAPPLVRSHSEFERTDLETNLRMFWRSVDCCELCGIRLGSTEIKAGKMRCALHQVSTHIIVPSPTNSLLRTHHLEQACVDDMALSPNSEVFACASYNAVRFYRSSDGRLLREIDLYLSAEASAYDYDDGPDPRSISCIAWSSDGRSVSCGSQGGDLWLLAADTGKVQWQGQASDGITAIAFSPNSAFLAYGDWEGNVKVCRTSTGDVVREFDAQTGKISGLAWSPDGEQLASASWDDDVFIWGLDDGQQIQQLEGHSPYPEHVAWSPDGLSIATCDMTSIRIWGISGQEIRVFREGVAEPKRIAWRPDSRILVSASGQSFASAHPLHLWHMLADQPISTLEGHTGLLTAVTWDTSGKLIVSSSVDKTVRFWRIK